MTTYSIWRFTFDNGRSEKPVRMGLTLEETQAHCNDKATHGIGWFDGYEVWSSDACISANVIQDPRYEGWTWRCMVTTPISSLAAAYIAAERLATLHSAATGRTLFSGNVELLS